MENSVVHPVIMLHPLQLSGGKLEMCCSDGDEAMNGEVKIELDIAEDPRECPLAPIMVEPIPEVHTSECGTLRRSGRPVKKRSTLLPGEQPTGVRKYQKIMPRPTQDNIEQCGDAAVFPMVEVKPESSSAPKKKRAYRRKPKELPNHAATPAVAQKTSDSVNSLLGQLVSVYCGNDNHPTNCTECRSRIEAIRALLQSSGKCQQSASPGDDSVAVTGGDEPSTELTSAGDGLFCCAKCTDRFNSFLELKQHEQLHAKGMQECNICHRHLSSGTSMAVHLRTHTGEKPFSCDDCGAKFAANKTLKEHRQKHTGERPYPCQHCGRTFSRKFILKVHERTHTGDLPYRCDECGAGFAQPGLLKRHSYKHSADGPPLPRPAAPRRKPSHAPTCPECGKTLANESSLKAHRFLHTGARPFVCTICDARFTRQQHLIDHTARHTGSKPHVCEQCGARFSRPYSLRIHHRLHTRETPFACEQCGLMFPQSSNLRQHVRSRHTFDKPYVCSYCGQKFAWAKDRQLHERRRHTGEKPFSCDACECRFFTKHELRAHQRARHMPGNQPVEIRPRVLCPYCPSSFVKKSTLKRHIEKHSCEVDPATDIPEIPKPTLVVLPSGSWSKDLASQKNSRLIVPPAKNPQQNNSGAVYSVSGKPAPADKRRRHFCPHCQLSFSQLALLSRHVRKHFSISDSDVEEEEVHDGQLEEPLSTDEDEEEPAE